LLRCLATGNVGAPGTGANIFRGHTNIQGATDLGLDITTLPLYYGLVEGAWKHWARVWEFEYDWLQSRFDEVPPIAGRKPRSRKENTLVSRHQTRIYYREQANNFRLLVDVSAAARAVW